MGHVEIEDLSFTYPSRTKSTLQSLNTHVEPGEFVLLTGSTGCGKSTLLRVLNGLIPHSSGGKLCGHARIDGVCPADQPLAVTCQKVGLLFQNPDDQFFCAVVEDEIAFGLENLGISSGKIDLRIDLALTQVGLSEFRNRPISTLSGGEKQRVALACLCAMEPPILLLDEPTSYLDSQASLEILDILCRLNREEGKTVVVATHRVNEIAPLCDRVWLMSKGELALDLPKELAFLNLETYRELGVEVPELAQIAEKAGFSERPLTLEQTVELFRETHTSQDQVPETISSRSVVVSCHPLEIDVSCPPLVSVQNITLRYPRAVANAVTDISFEVNCGEVVAIMGANGSGKTTLLSLISGLMRASEGQVVIDGECRKRWKPHHVVGKVGVVFQNPDLLLQAETVSDEVVFGPRNLKLSGVEISNRRDEVLRAFDLNHLRTEAPHALSRGQRQRTAIASIFSLYPGLFLLDEPTTGQDFQHIQQSMRILCEDVNRQIRTLIFCTHDTQLALNYADRVLLLRGGSLIFDGAPLDAFADREISEQASLIPPLWMQFKSTFGEG